MSVNSARLPAWFPPPTAGAARDPHRRRDAPEDHRCSCGRLRDGCVRRVVHALWAEVALTRRDPAR